jgi:hypothetical protein
MSGIRQSKKVSEAAVGKRWLEVRYECSEDNG